MKPLLIQTTCESIDDARLLADILLTSRLAACIQISAPVQSRYWWDGKLEENREYIVMIKSTTDRFAEIEKLITVHHPYDVPEIIGIEIDTVSSPYQQWLQHEMIT